jgi:cellulose synthase operon protein C
MIPTSSQIESAEYAAQIQQVRELYDQGLYSQAYKAGSSWGKLSDWPGTRAQILAARIANNVGSARLGIWLIRCAYRQNPTDAETRYFFALNKPIYRGMYGAWQYMQQQPDLPESASADLRSSWYAINVELAGRLRDFTSAYDWLARAEAIAPDNPWIVLTRADLYEYNDRYPEALEQSVRALELRPWYRPAVQAHAHLLTLNGKQEEALDFLQQGSQKLESLGVTFQLLGMQMELKQYQAAEQTIERVRELWLFPDKKAEKWLNGHRSEIAYFQGNHAQAIELAENSDNKFLQSVAAKMKIAPETAKTVQLPVEFVRQHDVTCVPATLSAISRYWQMPTDHVQLAEQLTYNGTSAFYERRWARENGWVPREFSIDIPTTQALIDRGIPFTFTTVQPGNAHLQAITGYDSRRDTFFIRDPYLPYLGEALADKIIESYRRFGPRGMALVPADQADKYTGLQLPDAEYWDLLHELDGALDKNNREAAGTIYQSLQQLSTTHRLTLEARRRLAIFDSNQQEQLAAVDTLLQEFPEDQNLILERLRITSNHERREERLAAYDAACKKKENSLLFWQQYAQELRFDARRHEDAIYLLRRAMRRWPTEASFYFTLATIYWDQRRYDEAMGLYHIAACLEDKDDYYVLAYFKAATWFKQTDAVLEYLRQRVERWQHVSNRPIMTLVSALYFVDRHAEAYDVLEAALAARPDDAELKVYVADMLLSNSQEHLPRARELMLAVKSSTPTLNWYMTMARIEETARNTTAALELFRKVVELVPLHSEAHAAIARILNETDSRAAATEHLRLIAAQYPHHYPLQQIWIEWIRDEDLVTREAAIRQMLEAHTDDAWAHREWGHLLCDGHRYDEAQSVCDMADKLEPQSVSNYLLAGRILRGKRQYGAAKQKFLETIKLSADSDLAVSEAMNLCDTIEERREVLKFLEHELETQVLYGDGLLSYREHAANTLEPEELLAQLEKARQSRPDLWHTWSASSAQLASLNRLDEAWAMIQEGTARFPLLPRMWIDQARIAHARLDAEAERTALENAYRINPNWTTAIRMYADFLDNNEEFAACRELLEKGLSRSPLDPILQLKLAESYYRGKEPDKALDLIQKLVAQEPGYTRAWDLLGYWATQQNRPELPRQAARQLVEKAPHEARSWLVLAGILDTADEREERITTLQKALELNPRLSEAYDQLAMAYVEVKDWDAALKACRPEIYGDQIPNDLRGRAAWIKAEAGEVETAIEWMREVVAEEPYFYWGWSRLADWYSQLKKYPEYLQAAEALMRIEPQYEVSLGYYAEALQLNDRLVEAKEAYAHAYELNPRYEFGGLSLFDLALEQKDTALAAQTLETLEVFSAGPLVTARGIQLACQQQQKELAFAKLNSLATEITDQNKWPLNTAVKSMVDCGWQNEAEAALFALAKQPDVVGQLGQKWMELSWARNGAVAGNALQQLSQNRATLRQAGREYLERLKDYSQESFDSFVTREQNWLRSDDDLWGYAGYCYCNLLRYDDAFQWMSDYQRHEPLERWVRGNLIECARSMNQLAIAKQMQAQELAEHNPTWIHCAHTWTAVDAINNKQYQLALDQLDALRGEKMHADDDFVYELALTQLELHTKPESFDVKQLLDLLDRLSKMKQAYKNFAKEPARKAYYNETIKLLRQHLPWYRRWLATLNSLFEG